jgi:hypothetical protein
MTQINADCSPQYASAGNYKTQRFADCSASKSVSRQRFKRQRFGGLFRLKILQQATFKTQRFVNCSPQYPSAGNFFKTQGFVDFCRSVLDPWYFDTYPDPDPPIRTSD